MGHSLLTNVIAGLAAARVSPCQEDYKHGIRAGNLKVCPREGGTERRMYAPYAFDSYVHEIGHFAMLQLCQPLFGRVLAGQQHYIFVCSDDLPDKVACDVSFKLDDDARQEAPVNLAGCSDLTFVLEHDHWTCVTVDHATACVWVYSSLPAGGGRLAASLVDRAQTLGYRVVDCAGSWQRQGRTCGSHCLLFALSWMLDIHGMRTTQTPAKYAKLVAACGPDTDFVASVVVKLWMSGSVTLGNVRYAMVREDVQTAETGSQTRRRLGCCTV
ncbi:hypothetical protein WJX72_001034 [[Myrmecia] bisecta]|uniref:Uncharacterized protein n=1 Tax=[Myrmecia] bisecta TaxID=41462 RepID=A0AAW1QP57_9CHLO